MPRKRMLIVTILLVPVALGALILSSRAGARASLAPEPKASGAPAVTLAPVRAVESRRQADVTGSLEPVRALQLGFEIGGRLSRVAAPRAARVAEGQVLAELDREVALAQRRQAEAALRAAEAQADIARDTAERQGVLHETGSISEWQYRSSAGQARAAEAQTRVAAAAVEQARAALGRHTLRAPYRGTIVDAPDQIGAAVAPGAPLITLEQIDTLVLRTTVPDSVRDLLRPGARVRVEAVGRSAATDDARLRAVIPSADASTRRVPVEIVVPNEDGRFTAHTLARALLSVGDDRPATALPASALATAGGDHVLVVDRGGALRRVAVTVLDRGAEQVVVEGLAGEEAVVDFPPPDLGEGSRVQIQEPPSPARSRP